jgi:hypothetical protein
MQELGLDIAAVLQWFEEEHDSPYLLIRVPAGAAEGLAQDLAAAIRRCYIDDDDLAVQAAAHEEDLGGTLESRQATVIGAKLPDPGSTMAGDFGEIITYLFQAVRHHPQVAFGPKKWRLKQDRTKPAPYSDVVHFVLPQWPTPCEDDQLLCAEVKTKSTSGDSRPIQAAIADSAKDRTSRLAKTLVWLRDRAITHSLGTTTLAHLNRFIKATDHPEATKRFFAVAVVCSDLVEAELQDAPQTTPDGCSVVVVAVPKLKAVYEACFATAKASIAPEGSEA